jgi:V/A-type H+-transporting ATPase subunit I
MTEMRKLAVILFEDHIDAVIRSLGEAGMAQFVDMREKLDVWKGSLVPHQVPTEILTRCSDILSKIDVSFKDLNVKPEEMSSEQIPSTNDRIGEVLTDVERKMAELPVESLAKSSKLLSRIDQLAQALEVKLEDIRMNEILLEKPAGEVLAEIERELSEIEAEAATSGLTDRKALMDRMKDLTFEEKIEVGRRLLEFRKSLIDTRLTFGKKLSRLRKLADMARQSIEAKTKLGEIREDMLTLRDTVKRERQVAEVEERLARTAKTIYFEVWVPDIHLEEVVGRIQKATGGNCVTTDKPVDDDERQPTVPRPVPNFIGAFEKLTLSSGYPSAHEVNPIRIMAITFPMLFGIMFADVGQGAIFVVLGTLLSYFKRKIKLEEAGEIVRYLLIGAEMFIFLGIAAIFWGLIFGEFFGPSGVLHPIKLATIGPFHIGGFEPMHEPMKMIRFAILVGALHISLGLILKLVNNLRERHYKHAPIPIAWLWLLWGGLFMWSHMGGISSISRWFAEGGLMLAGLIVAPLLLIVVFTGIAEGFMEGVGFGVEVFAETLSHTLSYSRLMALGLVHSVMNYLFLVLGGVEHGHFPLSSIPIIATGTILVMIIEGLIVFVHTLRLHWIEWFSKFYSGQGIPFKPFKFT